MHQVHKDTKTDTDMHIRIPMRTFHEEEKMVKSNIRKCLPSKILMRKKKRFYVETVVMVGMEGVKLMSWKVNDLHGLSTLTKRIQTLDR